MHSARIELEFESEEEARLMYRALKPEIESRPAGGVEASITLSGNKILIYIEAENISKLRAAVNSYGRLAALIYDVGVFVEEVQDGGSATPGG